MGGGVPHVEFLDLSRHWLRTPSSKIILAVVRVRGILRGLGASCGVYGSVWTLVGSTTLEEDSCCGVGKGPLCVAGMSHTECVGLSRR